MGLQNEEILQILLKNFNIKELLNPKLITCLEEELPNFNAVNLTITVGDDKAIDDIITFTHLNPEYVLENKTILDVNKGDTLNKIYAALKKYNER
ncbi:MAG: hypothetical protein Q8M06_00290 [Methanobacteriaceae archaeon]|jgi:hypothetical protein|nr:hypothetical protein [Methanobacteriaceae archaeon]MDZ4171979.1 hypothetical protein [Methanobacteriaceae archaeon]